MQNLLVTTLTEIAAKTGDKVIYAVIAAVAAALIAFLLIKLRPKK